MTARIRILALAIAAAISRPVFGGDLRFRIDVLQPLPGSIRSVPTDINDLGQIVGYADVGFGDGNIANQRPIIWDSPDAVPRVLWDDGFFPGFKGGRPRAINNHGVVVGQAQASSYDGPPLPTMGIETAFAFAWDEVNGLQSFVMPGELGPVSEALDINDSGYVVGNVGGIENEQHGIVWHPDGGLALLPPECQEYFCNARAINDAGQVAGWYGTESGWDQAFVWGANDGLTTIASPGSLGGRAYDLNNLGHVFGEDYGTRQSPGGPTMWSSELGLRYLTQPNGEKLRWLVRAGNDNDLVLGIAQTHSLVWDPVHGTIPLKELVIGADNWTLLGSIAINNRNQIAGMGIRNDRLLSYVLTPVPEPSSIELFAGFALSLVLVRFLRMRLIRRSVQS